MDLPIPVSKWHFVLSLSCVKAHTSYLLWKLSADEAEIPDLLHKHPLRLHNVASFWSLF